MAERERNPASTTQVQYQGGAEGSANGSFEVGEAADTVVSSSDCVDDRARKLDSLSADAGHHKEEGNISASDGKDASKQ